MSKKILVTGAGGYIGSITCDLLLKNGFEIVAIDNFLTGFKKPLELLQEKYGQDKLRFYEVDIRDDLDPILDKELNIEAAIHFAAVIVVNDSMRQPQDYFNNNVCGSLNLFSALIKHEIKKIVFSSTAAVYSEVEYLPIDEKHPTQPTNVYGQTKLMMEQIIQWYGKLLGLNYIIFRYFNVCGASEDSSFGYSQKASTHLIPNAVKGALGIAPFFLTCPEVDTPDKTPVRDYINVVDLADAHLKALNYLLNDGQNEIINLGTDEGNSVLEIIDKIQEITGAKFDMQKSVPREGESAKLIASNKKAEKVLGWFPTHTLEQSIDSLIAWYKKYPKGWSD